MITEGKPKAEPVFPKEGESGPFRMAMFRGESVDSELKRQRGFASDPGDYGRGEYWTDSQEFAATYGEVRTSVIQLKNALRLELKTMAQLIRDEYGMTQAWKPHEFRIAAADRFTSDMKSKGYDGIVVFGYEMPGIWSACVFDP
jgi:hypothetical protein